MADTDLLILGAGLTGLPVALAAAQAGWQVTLVDHAETPDNVVHDELDQRCTAVGNASVSLLERWGVWAVLSDDAEPIQQVHISQRGYFGSVRLRAEELNVGNLGYVVENRAWTAALNQVASDHPNVRDIRGVTIESLQNTSTELVIATLSSGESISAKLLIAVDGVNSRVRDLVGIGNTHTDYEQSALLSTVRLSKAHNACAYERFTSAGPLALLPRPNNTMSVVWCLDAQQAHQFADYSDAKLLSELQEQFGYRLGRFREIGARISVPLLRREAVQQVGVRTVLLGNAARLLHPVAGQGFNLALRDTAALLDLIGQRCGERANDPGRASLLKQFAEIRRSDQQGVVQLTDTLARVFRGRAALPGHARGMVLSVLDTVGPLRSQFAKKAMGFRG